MAPTGRLLRRRGGGQHGAEVAAERLHPARMQTRHALVERRDGEAERHLALVLDPATVEHQQIGTRGALADGGQQRALADPRLAHHTQYPAATRARVLERQIHDGELAFASHQPHVVQDAPALVPYSVPGTSTGHFSSMIARPASV